MKEELGSTKQLIGEARSDIEESQNRLRSLAELQSELSTKLQSLAAAKSQAESQLEKAVGTRAQIVRGIEELRKQRGVLRRRIEFCREKDAVETAARTTSAEMGWGFREYSGEDVRLATDDYSERSRLKSGGDWTGVYRARLSHNSVAIKMLPSTVDLEDFQAQVSNTFKISGKKRYGFYQYFLFFFLFMNYVHKLGKRVYKQTSLLFL